ncbi:unnamed protein product, partial [Brachionus calyciflorus]
MVYIFKLCILAVLSHNLYSLSINNSSIDKNLNETLKEIDNLVQSLIKSNPDSKWKFFNLMSVEYDGRKEIKCGQPTVRASRIIGGDIAQNNSMPWIVSMRLINSLSITLSCSGVLISSNLIVISASCVRNLKLDEFFFTAGSNSLNEKIDFSNYLNASEVLIHHDLNINAYYNNIALVRLKNPIEFSESVMPICLPETNEITEIYNKTVFFAGWGSVDGTEINRSNQLKITKLSIMNDVNQTLCYFRKYVDYCAIGKEPEFSNACFGDFGGPLMYIKNNKWYVYGVLNFIFRNTTTFRCRNSEPTFFTMVPYYLDWIKENFDSFKKVNFDYQEYECGLNGNKHQRIVYGRVATNNSWPWMVQIRSIVLNYRFICNGVLISQQHVLTSCGTPNINNLIAVLGTNKLEPVPDISTVYSFIDLNYSPTANITSLANYQILKLHKPVKISESIRPICLPFNMSERLVFDKSLYTSGWGSNQASRREPSSNLIDTILIVKNNLPGCAYINTTNYCVLGANNFSNICHGDSGAPLMYNLNNK